MLQYIHSAKKGHQTVEEMVIIKHSATPLPQKPAKITAFMWTTDNFLSLSQWISKQLIGIQLFMKYLSCYNKFKWLSQKPREYP